MLPTEEAMEQHISEHEALQILQRLALDKRWGEFEHLLMTRFPTSPDKRRDIREMCS